MIPKWWSKGKWRRINLVIKWYDLWVGAYWDRGMRRLYILPIPCVGIMIECGKPPTPGHGMCSICGKHIAQGTTFIGTGDGSMTANGGLGSFAHAECYRRQRSQ